MHFFYKLCIIKKCSLRTWVDNPPAGYPARRGIHFGKRASQADALDVWGRDGGILREDRAS